LLDSGEPLRALVATLISRGLENTAPEPLPAVASREPLPAPRPTQAVYPSNEAGAGPSKPVDRAAPAPARRPLVRP
jgi:hypothetical protein